MLCNYILTVFFIFISLGAPKAECRIVNNIRMDIDSFEKTKNVNSIILRKNNIMCDIVKIDNRYTILYIGKSDYDLVNCLSKNMKYNLARIVITSDGGETIPSSVAGLFIKNRKMDVAVFGVCLSSCANYIAPAARHLTLGRYSILGLHGGPSLPDQNDLAKIRKSVEEFNLDNRSSSIKVINNSIKTIEFSYYEHLLSIDILNISPSWYDVNRSVRFRSVNDDGYNKFIVPNFGMIKSCISNNAVVDRFFYSDDVIKKIVEIYPFRGPLIFISEEDKMKCS